MTQTHTPLIIEGKIFVVVDAPEMPNDTKPFDSLAYEIEMRYFDLDLAACTKYETLPEHAPYWKERIGQRVEVEFETENEPVGYAADSWRDVTYAIPPQQKQGDENWKVKFKDILMHADNRSGLETSIFTNEEWDYICSVLK